MSLKFSHSIRNTLENIITVQSDQCVTGLMEYTPSGVMDNNLQ